MRRPSKKPPLVSEVRRSGVPFTMYFTSEQAEKLASLARDRRVSKATLIRYAVERLMEQLEKGQFELPLGF